LRLAVDRVRAARRAIDDSGTGVLLTGRSEGFITGRPDLAETIRRLVAYAEAAPDCSLCARCARAERHRRDRQRRCAETGQRARRRRLPDRGAACRSRRPSHQRRRRARPRRVDRFLIAAKEIAAQGTFTGIGRGISVPEMNSLFGTSGRHGAG